MLDAQGPRRWRFLPYVVPILLLVGAIFAQFLDGGVRGLMFAFSVMLGSIIGLVPQRQQKKRDAELVCGPGYVEIQKAGTRSQRVHAKQVYGATTARTRNGISLVLAHSERDEPIVIEVADEGEADQVRKALGIGHGGFGTIAWRTVMGSQRKGALVGKVLALFSTAMITGAALWGSWDAKILSSTFLGMFGAAGVIFSIVDWLTHSAEPTVIMAPEGLRLRTTRGWFLLPYHQILGVEVEHDHLFFKVPEPWFQVAVPINGSLFGTGLSEEDRAALVAQIRSASERARGLGPQKHDPSARLDPLRRNGASVREWLERLDMAGQMLAQSTAGYRGNTLEPEDLWAILEDPEAETELRAAAARVLRHSNLPETRVRIDAAVAAVREASANKRLRVATSDDLEAASLELAQLEAEEAKNRLPAHLRFAAR